MLAVIGTSFTVEYAIKGAYEKTIGKLSELSAHNQLTEEDHYAAQVAQNYAAFVHIRPFYEFSFLNALRGLWHEVPFTSTHLVRSIERRAWLTLDFSFEAAYCELIELGTHATYGYEDTETAAWIRFAPAARAAILATPHTRIAKDIAPNELILELPRYQEFTPRALQLIAAGAHFQQISGNNLITVSVLAPSAWHNTQPGTQTLIEQPVPSQPGTTRTFLLLPVAQLHTTLPAMQQQGATIEHIYDF